MAKVRNLRVSDPTWERWEEEARKARKTTSEFIRDAVNEKLGEPAVTTAREVVTLSERDQANRQTPGSHLGPRTPVAYREVTGPRCSTDAAGSPRSESVPKKKRARTGLCEHRIPPDRYCKTCDA